MMLPLGSGGSTTGLSVTEYCRGLGGDEVQPKPPGGQESTKFKLGHCENQIRPQGVKTGQYLRSARQNAGTSNATPHQKRDSSRCSVVGSGEITAPSQETAPAPGG